MITEWEMKYHVANKVASDFSRGCAGLQGERDQLRAEVERKDALLRQALEFCEFAWRDVSMNEYAFEKLEQTITALRKHLGES